MLDGLEAGDRVVTNGAFLIDAETRLNPAAGSIYFGGSTNKTGRTAPTAPSSPPVSSEEEEDVRAGLAKLSTEDRKLAVAQGWCPVESENRLGAMGKPIKVMVKGQPVFLCCKGCQTRALAAPDQTLARAREQQARVKAESHKGPDKR